MANNLVIVESPTKSKTIEKFLGKNYKVLASMGHLRDLPKSTLGVDTEHDFEPKYINIRGKADLIKALKKEAQKADRVFLATDPDREGEAISWHLAFLLGIAPTDVCRVEFHEITKGTVNEALKHPRTIDMGMVDAQQARRIIDRLVGYKISPMLWPLRKGLSAGRVQSVAVKLVAERDAEIAAFVPVEYWTLNVKLKEKAKGARAFEAEAVKYKGKKLELHNETEARAAEEALKAADYTVTESLKKERKSHPAPPFTTSSLQQESNRRLNFSAKKTMMVAQQLYEGVNIGRTSTGLITYMRTDSVRMADVAVQEMREHILTNLGAEYCPAKPNYYATKKTAQDAHEAIRPTSVAHTPEMMAKYLNRDQLRLYTLIWNRAVASQMTDAVYDVTTLLIEAGDYQLKASGSLLKFKGYLALAGKSEDDEKDKKVPYLEVGTELALQELKPAEQHFTEPPAHYTEATLVKEMEDKGIGRPSTYATTLGTIQDRGYVLKEGKKLLITELGQKVNAWLTENFTKLMDVPYTASMEAELDNIAECKADKVQVIRSIYDYVESVKPVPLPEPPAPEPTGIFCDKCGREMVVKDGRFGKFLACPGFPDCRNIKPIQKDVGVPCPKCGGKILEKKSRNGKIFYGCENYANEAAPCDYTSWDKPLPDKCDLCGSMLVEHIDLRKRRHRYCSNPECSKAKPLYSSKDVNGEKNEAAAENATTSKTPKKTTAVKTKTSSAKRKTAGTATRGPKKAEDK